MADTNITLKPGQIRQHVSFNYISIVEDKSLAFLSPLLDSKTCPKRVILVADESLHTTLYYCKNYLISKGIQCDTWSIASHRGLQYIAQSLASYLEAETQPLALNMGHSNNLIAVLLQHYFLMKKWPVFYCEKHELKSIYPQFKSSQLHPSCKIREFFEMQMSDLKAFHMLNEFDQYVLEFAKQILQSLDQITHAFSILQRLAITADHNLQSEKVTGNHLLENKFQQLVEQFEKAGCCDLQKGSIVFANSLSQYITKGGWITLNICDYLFAHPQEFKVYDILCAVWVENKMSPEDLLYFDSLYMIDDYLYAVSMLPSLTEHYEEQILVDLWRFIHNYTLQCKIIHARPIVISHTHVSKELKQWSETLGVRLYDQSDLQDLSVLCSQMFAARDSVY